MIIKIDIDGVLRNTFKRMAEIYNLEFDEKLNYKNIKEYSVDKIFPRIKRELNLSASYWIFQKHSYNVFFGAEMFSDVKKSIDKLIDAGHYVSIVSYQQTYINMKHTLMWLNFHDIKFHNISFTDKKYLVAGDYLIDDNVKFLEDEEKYGSGIPIMIKRSYNSSEKRFKSYNSLNDFVDEFLNNNTYENSN